MQQLGARRAELPFGVEGLSDILEPRVDPPVMREMLRRAEVAILVREDVRQEPLGELLMAGMVASHHREEIGEPRDRSLLRL